MKTQLTLLTAVCIVAAITPLFSSYRHLQMLQQNSYYPSRYLKWLYNSFFNRLLMLTLVFCALSIVFKFSMIAELAVVCAYLVSQIYFAFKAAKESVKKLVFTARIIRLIIAEMIISAVLCLLAVNFTGVKQGIFFSLLILFSVFSPLLILLAWLVTQPVEKAVSKHYINDAKRIIGSADNLTVIGITGSYGKTGTKFILSRILSEKFNVVATPKSFNTTMGVVKTVRENIRPQTQVFICEMGAKNIGDIKEICDIVHPSKGIITAVGPQHLETFRNIGNVFKTKFELYDECVKNGGEVFVNADSPELYKRLADKNVRTYGIQNGSAKAENVSFGREGSSFTINLGEVKIPVETKLLGKHNVINIVGAAALAYSMGLTAEDISFAVSRLEPTEHRLQLKPSVGGSVMIDDAYNANPEGCIEAVNVLSNFKGMKKVIITPGLVELGNKEYDFNYKLGIAAAKVCDEIILVGQKRSVPMSDAVKTTDFDLNHMYVVSSFAQAMQVLSGFADGNTVFLVENDLPDNYLN